MKQVLRAIYRNVLPARLRTYIKAQLRAGAPCRQPDRKFIADAYLTGTGIEIGALHKPLDLPFTASVKYVDRMSVADLRRQYPELGSLDLVHVHIIDDGERLSTIPDGSQDFVIANHFIEHCQNPIMTLANIFRVLKEGGVLYLGVPDKRFTFDKDRQVTPLEHIVRDYWEGPEWSKEEHFHDWVRLVNKVEDDRAVEQQVAELIEIDYSIHFHVWTQSEIIALILSLREHLDVNYDIEIFLKHRNECIFVLRKLPPESYSERSLRPEPEYAFAS
jgi:predicted SAM-dependent methyltransferase